MKIFHGIMVVALFSLIPFIISFFEKAGDGIGVFILFLLVCFGIGGYACWYLLWRLDDGGF